MSAGIIIALAQSTAPDDAAAYLPCSGQAVSRATYSALFGVIGTAFGAGDGTSTFNVPDLRGVFPRGVDLGRGTDPGRTRGTFQDQAVQEHIHNITTHRGGGGGCTTCFEYALSFSLSNNINPPFDPAGGAETRPPNIAMGYWIKT